jgi:hypothetical protein
MHAAYSHVLQSPMFATLMVGRQSDIRACLLPFYSEQLAVLLGELGLVPEHVNHLLVLALHGHLIDSHSRGDDRTASTSTA